MKVSRFTRGALAIRREHRDLTKGGWEHVDERGGRLWELHRGGRLGWRIVECKISADGRTLWVKTEKPEA